MIGKHVYDLVKEGKSRREISRILGISVFQVFRIMINNKRRQENWNSTTSIEDRKG